MQQRPTPVLSAGHTTDVSRVTGSRSYWLRHVVLPGFLFTAAATVLALTPLDLEIARAWAFNPSTRQFVGAGTGAWWAKTLLHTDFGAAIRAFGALLAVAFALSSLNLHWRPWRRPLAYLLLAGGLAVGLTGSLRAASNVDCPWSLKDFNGNRPYVALFSDRPDTLPRARCFPGAHSASGFALFSFYFLYARRSRVGALAGLGVALGIGGLFAFGQEARGAHFLSHDLWSAAIAWFTCLAVYWLVFTGDVWGDQNFQSTPRLGTKRGQ